MQISVWGVKPRRGLSLIELLLTLAATLFIASLGWEAGTTAISCANNARMAVEMSKINESLDAFCMTFGSYPPDFHDTAAVVAFFKREFPSCPQTNYPVLTRYSPASALYFWLGGPNGNGFSANPKNPFDDGKGRIGPFFQFNPDQLKMVDGVMQYFPPRGLNGSPYVYFCGGAKGYNDNPGWPPAQPYRNSKDGSWINPKTYQVLCPGNDGKFGHGCHYPNGEDYDEANFDDLTSFSRGDTMKQEMPQEAGNLEKPTE